MSSMGMTKVIPLDKVNIAPDEMAEPDGLATCTINDIERFDKSNSILDL